MRTVKLLGILAYALFFMQPMFAQSSSCKVVATRIKTENNSYDEQELLREINAYLHSAFEKNDYALVSLDEKDRDVANKLELLNYIDANVRGTNGEAVDYVVIIWLSHIDSKYKIWSKKIGRTNTDYKEGIPIEEEGALIRDTHIRELVSLEIAKQYVGSLSQQNQVSLDKGIQYRTDLIEELRAGTIRGRRRANAKALGLSIIPGVGLMQKGRTGEGVAYLIGDVALVGGGIGMLAYADKQLSIMNDRSTNYDQFIKAKSNYDTAKTASYFCFGTAAALYVVNLVRSYVAEPKPGARIQWAVVPSMNPTSPYGPNMSVNLALAYKF